jgi:hypothetical protein
MIISEITAKLTKKYDQNNDQTEIGASFSKFTGKEKISQIPINQIKSRWEDDHKADPQYSDSRNNIENIKKQIKKDINKIPPILVRRLPKQNTFQVIDGHHRYFAFREMNIKIIPTIILNPIQITGQKFTENNNPQYLLHGSPNNNLTLNAIQLFNPNAKQNKNNKKYGGFYTTNPTDINQAQKYATPTGSIYKIEIKPNANIITKNNDITRLSQNTINQYLNNNIDIIKGKDPRGYTEYAIINTNIITNITKLTNLTENMIKNTKETINEK